MGLVCNLVFQPIIRLIDGTYVDLIGGLLVRL